MPIEPDVTFRGMDPSPAVDARIRERTARLAKHYERVGTCRVSVEAPHRHAKKGRVFRVAIDIAFPGGEVFVGREPGLDHAHEDVYVALRDAFDAAERQLAKAFEARRDKT